MKGRGTGSTVDPRYLAWRREDVDDGWEQPQDDRRIATSVVDEHPRTIISRNSSPDIPFEQSINPYRGCEHGCVYCLKGDTQILMADGATRALAEVRVGDEVYGTVRMGWYRRYVKSRVLAHWSVVKPAYRVTLADGTELIAGPDHRFLTERGWKFITGSDQGRQRRPHLTRSNKLMGTGAYSQSESKNREYRSGYLCGMIRGDALLKTFEYQRPGRKHGNQHQFRLALCDVEGLQRTEEYLKDWDIDVYGFKFQTSMVGRRDMYAIRTNARASVDKIRSLIAWPERTHQSWCAGFLAGVFDAEGSYSRGILRISNSDHEIVSWIGRSLKLLGFRFALEDVRNGRKKPLLVVRVTGGLREHLRFFHHVDPVIRRKCDITGLAVKSEAELQVVEVESLGKALQLFDITTTTGDFIANGVVSHNCYARPTHAYMDLSPGIDFETKLFAKPDAPELLRRELGKKGYLCKPIALGTNTDPYQPVERDRGITRAVIEVLSECNHPLTIVTKSWLVERDIDLLAPMAERRLVQVFLSVTSLDQSLTRRLEPRASAPRRRLQAIARLHAAGIPVGVMFAPVIPFINDAELEAVLEQGAAAGARWAGYVIVRLPNEIRELFQDWLQQHEPLKAQRVMNAIRALRGGRDYDSAFFRRQRGTGVFADLIRKRFESVCGRLGLNKDREILNTDLFKPPGRADGQMDMF